MQNVLLALKAFLTGTLMIIPGISGGAIAMVFGEYDNLINSVSGLFSKKTFKQSFVYLLIFSISGAIGIFLMSYPMKYINDRFYYPLMYFVISAIFASVGPIVKKSKISKKNWYFSFLVIFSFYIVYFVFFASSFSLNLNLALGITDVLSIFFAGLVMSLGFILPGVSVSLLFMIFGLYEEVISAISNLDLLLLFPLLVGLALGTVLFSKLIEKAMKSIPYIIYPLILGFLLSSVLYIYPGAPKNNFDIILSFFTFILGFSLTSFMNRGKKRLNTANDS